MTTPKWKIERNPYNGYIYATCTIERRYELPLGYYYCGEEADLKEGRRRALSLGLALEEPPCEHEIDPDGEWPELWCMHCGKHWVGQEVEG